AVAAGRCPQSRPGIRPALERVRERPRPLRPRALDALPAAHRPAPRARRPGACVMRTVFAVIFGALLAYFLVHEGVADTLGDILLALEAAVFGGVCIASAFSKGPRK